jgi:ACR3 family arsenite transporter
MTIFEKFLSIWIALAILAGIIINILFPDVVQIVANAQYANVNIVVAILIWAMVYPMMVGVNFSSVLTAAREPRGLIITVLVNWMIKPFTMALLAVLFFDYVFASYLSPETSAQYTAGLILLGAAPCTAMVFVWSHLTKGDPAYTLVQVSVNDVIMVFAFAPIVAVLLGVTEVIVPWKTLVFATILYVVLPLVAGIITRLILRTESAIQGFSHDAKPFSTVGLIVTVVILFAMQGETIIKDPLVIAMIAVPILIQSYGIFLLAYGWAYLWKVPHRIAAPCALIGTSNFFELAVAVAISLFGLNSGAALATVVGILVEVPVMLSLVAMTNKTRKYFLSEHRSLKN